MDFATVFSAFNLTDAQLVCSRLEAADFHPFIANENTASWLGGFGGFSTASMIRVQVPENEARDAIEFLETK